MESFSDRPKIISFLRVLITISFSNLSYAHKVFRDLLYRIPSLTSAYLLVSKQKYGVSLTSLKAQLTDWFNDEKQKYFVSRDDLVERARELANELDIDDSAVDHGFVRYL